MRAEDLTDTLDIALAASGCDSARVLHKLRLLRDNESSYIASDLAEYRLCCISREGFPVWLQGVGSFG